MNSMSITRIAVFVPFNLSFNPLIQCSIPDGLTNLRTVIIEGTPLRNFTLPAGLTNMSGFFARDNQLTNLTFPADMTNLSFVDIAPDPDGGSTRSGNGKAQFRTFSAMGKSAWFRQWIRGTGPVPDDPTS